jgi:hypothetical protein
MMPTLVLDSEELSLLRACVALVLGGVYQNEGVAIGVSNIIKKKMENSKNCIKVRIFTAEERARKKQFKPPVTALSQSRRRGS